MPEIRLLDDNLINKIAAGEIIEKPFAVVKELVDNSIDAGATEITVSVINGGMTNISVLDNGYGIEKEQIEKAFMRHTTSKIQIEDDLLNIRTMGFRGEALASIASVSNVTMSSKTKNDSVGRKITMEPGKATEIQAVGMNVGTNVEVEYLFANVPVRRKFLNKPSAESALIHETVQNFAIGNPKIAFKYINNDALILQTSGSGITINAVIEIHGKNIEEQFLSCKFTDTSGKFTLIGHLGKGSNGRNTRGLQYLYINKRFIRDKLIISEIEEAYKGRIMIGKFPAFVLNFDMPLDMLDVNIHPHKSEVRFEDEYLIRTIIRKSMKSFFAKEESYEKATWGKEETPCDLPKTDVINEPSKTPSFNNDFLLSKLDDANKLARKDEFLPMNSLLAEALVEYNVSQPINDSSKNTVFQNDAEQSKKIAEEVNNFHKKTVVKVERDKNTSIANKFNKILKSYKIVGQVFSTYIIIESGNSLYMIDQHAAHERVLYEKYYNSLKNEKVASQILLEPITLKVTPKENEVINENIEIFDKFGFDIQELGFGNIAIRSVPIILKKIDNGDFFVEILNQLLDTNSYLYAGNPHEMKSDLIATMACKAAIKANNKINDSEIKYLLEKLSKLDNPFNCPHGRPTIIEMTKNDIEKKFKRRK